MPNALDAPDALGPPDKFETFDAPVATRALRPEPRGANEQQTVGGDARSRSTVTALGVRGLRRRSRRARSARPTGRYWRGMLRLRRRHCCSLAPCGSGWGGEVFERMKRPVGEAGGGTRNASGGKLNAERGRRGGSRGVVRRGVDL